jgi:hypothetical protein
VVQEKREGGDRNTTHKNKHPLGLAAAVSKSVTRGGGCVQLLHAHCHGTIVIRVFVYENDPNQKEIDRAWAKPSTYDLKLF